MQCRAGIFIPGEGDYTQMSRCWVRVTGVPGGAWAKVFDAAAYDAAAAYVARHMGWNARFEARQPSIPVYNARWELNANELDQHGRGLDPDPPAEKRARGGSAAAEDAGGRRSVALRSITPG
eukprot:gene12870-24307_t